MSMDIFRNMLQTEPQVFRLICEFDSRPAGYIARDRLCGLIDGRWLDAISTSRRGRRELSRWLCRHYDLAPVGFAEFAEPRRRLALLEPDALRRLLTYAGAAAASSEIAKTVDRAAILALRNALGDDAYWFAVKRAPFLLGDELAFLDAPSESPDWTTRIRRGGCRCLALCLAGESAAIQTRVMLKLDARWPLDFSVAASEEKRQLAWTALRKILLHEIDSGLSSCFN